MKNNHDVVVIGGSLSGAACVRELARLGIDAIALERDRFPRGKVCGGFLSPGAVNSLEGLGLLDEIVNAGAVKVSSARVRAGVLKLRFRLAVLPWVFRATCWTIFLRATRECSKATQFATYSAATRDLMLMEFVVRS